MTTDKRKEIVEFLAMNGVKARLKESTQRLLKKKEKLQKELSFRKNPFAQTKTEKNRNRRNKRRNDKNAKKLRQLEAK